MFNNNNKFQVLASVARNATNKVVEATKEETTEETKEETFFGETKDDGGGGGGGGGSSSRSSSSSDGRGVAAIDTSEAEKPCHSKWFIDFVQSSTILITER